MCLKGLLNTNDQEIASPFSRVRNDGVVRTEGGDDILFISLHTQRLPANYIPMMQIPNHVREVMGGSSEPARSVQAGNLTLVRYSIIIVIGRDLSTFGQIATEAIY